MQRKCKRGLGQSSQTSLPRDCFPSCLMKPPVTDFWCSADNSSSWVFFQGTLQNATQNPPGVRETVKFTMCSVLGLWAISPNQRASGLWRTYCFTHMDCHGPTVCGRQTYRLPRLTQRKWTSLTRDRKGFHTQ